MQTLISRPTATISSHTATVRTAAVRDAGASPRLVTTATSRRKPFLATLLSALSSWSA